MTTLIHQRALNAGFVGWITVGLFTFFCLSLLAFAYFLCLAEQSRRLRRRSRRARRRARRRSALAGDEEAGVEIPERAHLPEEAGT